LHQSDIYCGTGSNKKVSVLSRSSDIDKYIKSQASKIGNWDEKKDTLCIWLSIGIRQDSDPAVSTNFFKRPTDSPLSLDDMKSSQDTRSVPRDMHNKKEAAKETKNRAIVCKRFFKKLYSDGNSPWHHGFTVNHENIMYENIVNASDLQQEYFSSELPTEGSEILNRCELAVSTTSELGGLMPEKGKFPPARAGVDVPPTLSHWKTTVIGNQWYQTQKKKFGNTDTSSLMESMNAMLEMKKIEMMTASSTGVYRGISTNLRMGNIIISNDTGVEETVAYGEGLGLDANNTLWQALTEGTVHPTEFSREHYERIFIVKQSDGIKVSYTKNQVSALKIGVVLQAFAIGQGEALHIVSSIREKIRDGGSLSD